MNMNYPLRNRLFSIALSLATAVSFFCISTNAEAFRETRDIARTNVHGNANVNRNVNANVNRNVNVNVNNNVNVNGHGGYYNHGVYYDHPVATAAVVTAGVAVTAAAIGSMVRTLPPSCSTVVVNGLAYQNCGNVWYQPQYAGTQVNYVVVNAPR
ncbi:DUF6515 family protein [Glaciimonas soli]|uniref:DUF6515 family protein n=1 Tax=Glaciimonas soli TaxID=2590999 RepID=UPI0018857354|nr:DUF6515 family protein [Glaciimonas soli]